MLTGVNKSGRTQLIEKREQNNSSGDIDKVKTLLDFMVTEYQKLYAENLRLRLSRSEIEQSMQQKDILISLLLSRLKNRDENNSKDKKNSVVSVGGKFFFLMNSQSSDERAQHQKTLLSKNRFVKQYDRSYDLGSNTPLEAQVKKSPSSIMSVNLWRS